MIKTMFIKVDYFCDQQHNYPASLVALPIEWRRYEEREGGDKWGGVVVDLISKTTKESYGDDGPLHLDGQRMGPNC